MECIYCQYSSRFFCVLYKISESLSRFWSYVSQNFGCLISLISLISLDLSSRCLYINKYKYGICPNFGSDFWFRVTYLGVISCLFFVPHVKYSHKFGLPLLESCQSQIVANFLLFTLFSTV